jgi:hypothetical protein
LEQQKQQREMTKPKRVNKREAFNMEVHGFLEEAARTSDQGFSGVRSRRWEQITCWSLQQVQDNLDALLARGRDLEALHSRELVDGAKSQIAFLLFLM